MMPPEVVRIPDAAALLEFDPGAIAEGQYDHGELT